MKIINQYQYLNYNVIKYDVLDSTMNLARHSQPNTIIVADMQTNGKGKMGRVWKSEKGNLYFSINIQASLATFESFLLILQFYYQWLQEHRALYLQPSSHVRFYVHLELHRYVFSIKQELSYL